MDTINTKTIIIGAGVSGISASVKLLNDGYNDFLVIEAQNRIGKLYTRI
jgi:monoamine oxidase